LKDAGQGQGCHGVVLEVKKKGKQTHVQKLAYHADKVDQEAGLVSKLNPVNLNTLCDRSKPNPRFMSS
jgi:hypothetical protein